MRHRGSETTEDGYRGIPADAATGVHEAVVDSLKEILPSGGRVADIGAGRGALSLRLADAGFEVVAFDLDNADWSVPDMQCYEVDVNTSAGLQAVASRGPYDAIVSVEVIEHLENPRQFLKSLLQLARQSAAPVVLSTPNPLDTFSAISFFRRGIFNWFSPAHYSGGGHISILPYWLINEHLMYLGIEADQIHWKFLAPWKAPRLLTRVIYRGIQAVHRIVTCHIVVDYTDGQTAIVVIKRRMNDS
ncbi:MAG: methyltransferase domain-containing protein [Fuerstiella sp.]